MGDDIKINRGLKGIYFERSAISDIDGAAGRLTCRGYSIDDLVTGASFEEVAHLIMLGELPTARELAALRARLAAARVLQPQIVEIIDRIKAGPPMDVLRTRVSARAALEPGAADASEAGFLEIGIRLTAQVPMIVAAHPAIRLGRTPTPPDPALGQAANWLRMAKGKTPSADAARLAEVDMILHAERGANASSFVARVTVGTEANLHGAIVTALSTLARPAHGAAA